MSTAVSAAPAVSAQPIQVEKFVKRFGATAAVNGVSLALHAGDCLGLLGPNGAGKTTLIRGIVGRVLPDGGSIRIFGAEAGSRTARQVLGWVPQELAIYPRLTCSENLFAFGKYQGISGKELEDQIAWCLGWASLTDRGNEPARNLSGGMKRRLNMAAGIIHRPRLVLMDEPTVGVDPQSRNRIFEMIEALRAQGTSILYTTHYMEEAERLCNRIAIIDHGSIIAEGTHEELVRNAFGSSSQVVARFAGTESAIAEWVEIRGGRFAEGVAQFTVQHPSEIAALLDDAGARGFQPEDVSLRRPNLESVFLHLTGRELRE
ncbi:MAG TPA: ABC transporter ATP-binding protein [Terracidiphilus sp.]|nr:ABC transporter ATP-binding protein [Terracidiphilus sp.]